MKEKNAFHVNGYLGLLVAIIGGLVGLWLAYSGFRHGSLGMLIGGVILIVLVLILVTSLTIIQPNEAKALTFGYDEAAAKLKALGFDHVQVLGKDGFAACEL